LPLHRHAAASALVALSAATAALALLAPNSHALPRYSARYEQNCALCHINPTGGGLRATYASQKLVPEEMAWSRGSAGAATIDPRIGKQLLIGTDFREMRVGSTDVNQRLGYFLMQADVYLGFQVDPHVTVYYDRGRQDSDELFGLAYFTPSIYAKAGRFVPPYGWKFDDHTMYVRSELGFQPPANSDVGLELGYSQGPLDLELAELNGSRGSILDTEPGEAQLASFLYRRRIGPLGAALGGSGYRHPGSRRDEDMAGPYGYLTAGRLTWLAEMDWHRQRDHGTPYQVSVVSSNEVSWVLHQGLELLATYDFYDPDRDQASGARSRWGGGLFVMPRPYATVESLVRWTRFQNGLAFSGVNSAELLIQLHLLY
jgi:hypothetical protein